MTQKRAKENENPEPQTGRGHKLTDRLGIGSWGTKNSRIARTRHTATTGTLRERTLRRGPAGGRRRGGAVPPPVASVVHATPGDPLRACLGACD